MTDNLIIGSGKRVEDTIIPALQILNENIYLYSRNKNSVNSICEKYDINKFENLNNSHIVFKRIFIAIPSTSLNEILSQLLKNNYLNSYLYIDTPIIGPLKNLNLNNFAKKFKEIYVTEDWISKPFFTITKKLINENKLGNIKEMIFYNSGYSYHALAAARSMISKNVVIFAKTSIKKNNIFDIKIYFKNSKLKLIYPINYKIGKIEIHCDKGIITNYLSDKPNTYYISNELISGKIRYYKVNGKKYDFENYEIQENILTNLLNINLKNSEIENQEKIISLCVKILEKDDKKYLLLDGAYDSFIFSMLNKFKIYFDLSYNNNSFLFTMLNSYINK